ncbi:18664_t:CDS:2, partial [Acaulospora morrowiae]
TLKSLAHTPCSWLYFVLNCSLIESPYQAEKHLHFNGISNGLEEYPKPRFEKRRALDWIYLMNFHCYPIKPIPKRFLDNEQDLLNNDTLLSTGLNRLRDDRSSLNDTNKSDNTTALVTNHLDLTRFSTESLHSYRFFASDASMLENRQNILRRSIEFMKSKIRGCVQNALFSSVIPTKDIVLPQEIASDNDSSTPRKFKRMLTDIPIPSLYTAINPSSTLHSPTRFTPQNQAIITTDSQSNILNVNDIACLIFGYSRVEILSIRALDLIASPFREKLAKSLAARPQDDHGSCEAVLACGKVGTVMKSSGDVKALYGYLPEDIVGMCITALIPTLETVRSNEIDDMMTGPNPRLDIDQINKTKYYGSRSKYGANFPIIGKISVTSVPEETPDERDSSIIYGLKIISIPTIAGVITAHATGIIQSCNSDFVKYLFGVGAQELNGKRRIESLLPQFPRLIEILASERDLDEGIVITENAFRRAVATLISHTKNLPASKEPSSTVLAMPVQGPSGIIAVHRDGTEFDVDIQMRVLESSDEPLHALWITYDRNFNFAKERPVEDVAITSIPSSKPDDEKGQDEDNEKFPISKFIAAGGRPPSLAYSSNDRRISVPPLISPVAESFDPKSYSAISLAKSIDDFIILESLGKGAYGEVKLAYNKNDPEKKKVVLKFVTKSRILVDCWTRVKDLGTVPLEIHILHTLRSIPHPNIVQMEMGLHGEGMDLFDYIELNASMHESEIKSIFRQVSRAIQHLHHNKIVHRDIKDENVILDKDGNVQLIDFGSSAYLKSGRKFDIFCGTIDYAAPEVLTGKRYDGPPQDIWALGILLYTLIYKENPFYNIDEIIARDLRIPYILSDGSIDLVKKMLDRDTDKRPSIDDVLNHPWLRED